MVVVIRLQGLRITAGSEDIRKFFTGLRIPDGGVHIIGGEREEAFILFASDEDARRAMTRSGGLIQGSPVTLLLSSKAEMQNLLERSTRNMEQAQERQFERHHSADPEMGRGPGSKMDSSFPPEHQADPNQDDGLCLFVKGLPFSVTEKEISEFFHGLFIDDIFLMKRPNGSNNGKGFIKFASREDALEGLKRDKEYIGTRYIEIFPTTIYDWKRAARRMPFMRNDDGGFERGRSPVFSQRNPPERMRSRSPVAQRHAAPSEDEYCVHLENLSYVAEKENIKQLFHKARLEDDQIMQLFDGEGRRTRSSFVMFKNPRDYCDALNLEKIQFLGRWVQIRPISKENMISLLESESKAAPPSGNTDGVQESPLPYTGDSRDSENICVFVRNLPFDVRKVEIMDFFHEFTVTEDNVCVLHDHKGAGVGKALVLFGSEAEAMRALSLNGRRVLGSEVILRSISRSQMQELMAEPPEVQQFPPQELFLGRSNEPSFPPGDSRHSGVRNPSNDGMPMRNVQGQSYGGFDYESRAVRSCSPKGRGNGVRHGFDPSGRNFDGPTCVQLVNLPFQIKPHEIYDFCYGYRVIPGSVLLQYEPTGKSKGSATLVFQSRQEALTAIDELSGRPIGPRKIQLLLA